MHHTNFSNYLVKMMTTLNTPRLHLNDFITIILRYAHIIFEPDHCSFCQITPSTATLREYIFQPDEAHIESTGDVPDTTINQLRLHDDTIYRKTSLPPDFDDPAHNDITRRYQIRSFIALGLYDEQTVLTGVIFLNYTLPRDVLADREEQLRLFQGLVNRLYRDVLRRLNFQVGEDSPLLDVIHPWRESLTAEIKNRIQPVLSPDRLSLYVYHVADDAAERAYVYRAEQTRQTPDIQNLSPELIIELSNRSYIHASDDILSEILRIHIDTLLAPSTQSWVIVPFTIRVPVGFLLVEWNNPREYSIEESNLLDTLANHIALSASIELLADVVYLSESSEFVQGGQPDAPLSKMVDRILEWLAGRLECASVWLYLQPWSGSDSTRSLNYPPTASPPPPLTAGRPDPPAEARFITHLTGTTYLNSAWVDHHQLASAAVIPLQLQTQETSPGLLVLGFQQTQAFTAIQRRILQAIVRNIASALETRRTFRQYNRKRLEEARELQRVLIEINAQQDIISSPYTLILEIVKKQYPQADRVKLWRYRTDSNKQRLEMQEQYPPPEGANARLSHRILTKTMNDIAWEALDREEPICETAGSDYSGISRNAPSHESPASKLAIPIFDYYRHESDDRLERIPRGVLSMESQQPDAFSQMVVDLQNDSNIVLSQFTTLIAIAWQNAERYEFAQKQQKRFQKELRALRQKDLLLGRQAIIDTLMTQIFRKLEHVDKCELYVYSNGRLTDIYAALPVQQDESNPNDIRYQGARHEVIEDAYTNGIIDHLAEQVSQYALNKPDEQFWYVAPDTNDYDLYEGPPSIRSELAIALIESRYRKLMAILNIESFRPGAFDKHTVQLLKPFVDTARRNLESWGDSEQRQKAAISSNDAEQSAASDEQFIQQMTEDNDETITSVLFRQFLHDMRNRITPVERNLKKQINSLETSAKTEAIRPIIEDFFKDLRQRIKWHEEIREVRQSPVQLSLLLRDAEKAFKQYGTGRHTWALRPDRESLKHIYIRERPGTMKSVFENLIHNAIDAMPSPGQLTIEVEEKPEQQQVVIYVTDTGTGIGETLRKNIFNRQVKGKDSGSGFGLYFVRIYVEIFNGGRIECESKIGQGTTFIITLPCRIEPPEQKET
jgi:signal transduction histidine kinase